MTYGVEPTWLDFVLIASLVIAMIILLIRDARRRR